MNKKNICMAVLAAVDSGKTTLSEALLYQTGQIRKIGRVDNGDAFLDTYDLEKKRGITIFSKQAVLSWDGMRMTLLDTPGHVDFSAEMERTLQVLDYAILVVSAPDGVQGHTLTLWNLLKRHQVPVFLFVNKMDQPGVDKAEVFAALKKDLSDNLVDFSNDSDDAFYENVALCREDALEQYLENGEIEKERIATYIREREIFPCYFGSALKMDKVDELLDGLQTYMKEPTYGTEFGAKVFKISRDEKGTRLTHVKITGGTLTARQVIENHHNHFSEKVNQIRIYSGEKYETVNEVAPGMICALTGLNETEVGMGLGAEPNSKPPVLEPVLTYSIGMPEGVDATTMLPKLRMLEEEEPELHIQWDENSQEILAQVMGEVQIEILQHLIEERFATKVTFDEGSIVYKETIRGAVHGAGHFEPLRHYAEVHLYIEPGEPGSGLVVATDCSEDVLDKNWQRLIVTHLLEREHKGVLTGSNLTDVKVTLIGGRAHLKHTEGGDFRQATYRAVRQGLMQAESVLLEPYYEYRLEIPDDQIGRAMTDLERMKAEFTLEQGANGMSVLSGHAPVALMRDYTKEVVAYSKGQGRLVCMLDGYRPCKEQDKIVEQIGYEPERDLENPADSVFCAHGAGYQVPWQEVLQAAHVSIAYGENKEVDEEEEMISGADREEVWLGVDEIDQILQQATSSNRKSAPVSHKGISAKRVRSVTEKPVGLSKPRKQTAPQEKYLLVDGYNII
ncbi:MAG: TetM/TetW/TetO/TetS family tetracycline resistance ribosomal protection protein, partial [Eubacterium sp.]|nr:TetM/TetW/TetO/TetS family tetracycline resistance ribosomal protection protein [Eubacterium sp.]